jgi:hypothetical protein
VDDFETVDCIKRLVVAQQWNIVLEAHGGDPEIVSHRFGPRRALAAVLRTNATVDSGCL